MPPQQQQQHKLNIRSHFPKFTDSECGSISPLLISVALELLSRLTDNNSESGFHSLTFAELLGVITEWLKGLAVVDFNQSQQPVKNQDFKRKDEDPYSVYPVWWWNDDQQDIQQHPPASTSALPDLVPMTTDQLLEKWNGSADHSGNGRGSSSVRPKRAHSKPPASTSRTRNTDTYFIPFEANTRPTASKPTPPPEVSKPKQKWNAQPSRIPKPPLLRPKSKTSSQTATCSFSTRSSLPEDASNARDMVEIARCALMDDDFVRAFSSDEEDNDSGLRYTDPHATKYEPSPNIGLGSGQGHWYEKEWAERDRGD